MPCFIDLFKEKNKTGNIVGIVVGVLLLLACNDLIPFDMIFKIAFPVMLILIGTSIIFKDNVQEKVKKDIKKKQISPNDNEHYAIFGSLDLNFSKEKFKGCYLNAIFGGIKCDLSEVKLEDDIVINVCSIFGGVDLIMPDDVNVEIVSTPIFGGVSDKVKNSKNNKNTLYINATCIFGGVEIK